MNFIGHALAASWERAVPSFALGAMLPDLVGMIGARLGRVVDADIAAGIAHHHRVDGVFHVCAPFLELQQVARDQVTTFSRGAARGVAHVAVELLLDGEISRAAPAREAFEGALRVAGRLSPERDLGLDAVAAARFGWMLARFAQVDLPGEYDGSSSSPRAWWAPSRGGRGCLWTIGKPLCSPPRSSRCSGRSRSGRTT